MKKTMTLLFAAMSSVFAATTDVTDLLVWDDSHTTASIVGAEFVDSEITVVLTLNWQNFDTTSETHDIFTISDAANHSVGIGMYYADMGANDINMIYSNQGKSDYTGDKGSYQTVPYTSFERSAVVFTATMEDNYYVITGHLYLWETDSESPNYAKVYAQKQNVKNLGYEWLTLGPNSVVDKVAVYSGVTENPLQLAENLINGVTVPEPTTATLSLLALAGLAARRRRH